MYHPGGDITGGIAGDITGDAAGDINGFRVCMTLGCRSGGGRHARLNLRDEHRRYLREPRAQFFVL